VNIRVWAVTLGVMFSLAPVAGAHAHGEQETTRPKNGARLRRPPDHVSMTLSEAPSDARVLVRDGCGRRVGGKTRIKGARVFAAARKGQAGRWEVRFKAVSSEDGHLSKGGFSFRVVGKRECDAAKTPSEPQPQDSAAPQANPPASTSEQPGEEAPIQGIAIGLVAVALVGGGAAAALRRRSKS
jgi:methionine-rich copper-binding protein CopC